MIAGDVFIHHYGSRTFIGNRIDYGSSLSGNRRIFIEKWSGEEVAQRFGVKLLVQNAAARADELFDKGDIEKATACLLGALKQAPCERSLYLRIAEMLVNEKRYQDAVGILEALGQSDSDQMQLALLGYCEEALGHNDKAREYAERALAIDPQAGLPMNVMGVLAFKNGECDVAEGYFRKAVEFNPGLGESYTNLGSLKWAAGETEEALKLFEQGFILSPTINDVAAAYHTAVVETKSFETAEAVFREAQALHPHHKRIAFLMIALLLQQEKHQSAMQEVEKAMIQFGIDDGILSAGLDIRNKIGPLEISRSKKNRATLSLCMIVKNEESHLAKCLMSVKPIVDEMIVVDTGSTDRTRNIALAFGAKVFDFLWTNDFSEARNYSLSKASGDWILVLDADEMVSPRDNCSLKKILSNGLNQRAAYLMVTHNYTDQVGARGWTANDGKYIEEEIGKGWVPSAKVRLFPNDKRIKFENPVHELVEPTLKKAGIKIKTCNIPIHHYGRLNQDKVVTKGEEYYLLGMKKILETKGDYYALKELAIQASELGKYDQAVRIWERVIELNPHDAVAYMNVGYAYLMLDQYGKASVFSKNALELDPDLREATLNYAGCELIAGNVKKAIGYLEKMLEKEPDYPPAMGRIAAAYLVDGQKKRGLKCLERLRKNGYDCASILEEQARALLSQGRTDQAELLRAIGNQIKGAGQTTLSLYADCKRIRKSKYTVSDHFISHSAN
jgi:tetratricopeptide (TPR) repeat protein